MSLPVVALLVVTALAPLVPTLLSPGRSLLYPFLAPALLTASLVSLSFVVRLSLALLSTVSLLVPVSLLALSMRLLSGLAWLSLVEPLPVCLVGSLVLLMAVPARLVPLLVGSSPLLALLVLLALLMALITLSRSVTLLAKLVLLTTGGSLLVPLSLAGLGLSETVLLTALFPVILTVRPTSLVVRTDILVPLVTLVVLLMFGSLVPVAVVV